MPLTATTPVDQLTECRTVAINAVLVSDIITARRYAMAALAILSTIPDGQLQGLSDLAWNRSGIEAFLRQLDHLPSASTTASQTGGYAIGPIQFSRRDS